MFLIQVKLIEGVFTAPQKREIIECLTEALVAIGGENMRRATWCVLEEVASGEWGIGGTAPTADDVRALAHSEPTVERPTPSASPSAPQVPLP